MGGTKLHYFFYWEKKACALYVIISVVPLEVALLIIRWYDIDLSNRRHDLYIYRYIYICVCVRIELSTMPFCVYPNVL